MDCDNPLINLNSSSACLFLFGFNLSGSLVDFGVASSSCQDHQRFHHLFVDLSYLMLV